MMHGTSGIDRALAWDDENYSLAAFAKKTFGMYDGGGEEREVVLLCRRELAGVVLDRFGHE